MSRIAEIAIVMLVAAGTVGRLLYQGRATGLLRGNANGRRDGGKAG